MWKGILVIYFSHISIYLASKTDEASERPSWTAISVTYRMRYNDGNRCI